MSYNVIGFTGTVSGKTTYYAVIRDGQGYAWNGSAFEVYQTANLDNYDIALTEQGTASRWYMLTIPSLVAGQYFVDVFDRGGVSPAEDDEHVAEGTVEWNGSTIVYIATAADGKVVVPDTQKVDLNTAKTRAVGDVGAGNTAHLLQSADSGATYVARAPSGTAPTGSVVDDNDPDPSTTAFETDLSEASDDHYNGAFLVFYSGALSGQARKISDYDGTTKVITVATAFTEAPVANDDFMIVGRSE